MDEGDSLVPQEVPPQHQEVRLPGLHGTRIDCAATRLIMSQGLGAKNIYISQLLHRATGKLDSHVRCVALVGSC